MIEPAGLGNVGYTCYLNTAIQCLSFCQPFLDFVLACRQNSSSLLGELKLLLTELRINHKTVIPSRFVSKVAETLDLPIYQQNDINEFITIFIDKLNQSIAEQVNIRLKPWDKNTMYDKQRLIMDTEWIKQVEKEYSELIPMFYGQTIMQITCGNCNYIGHNYEMFFNIMLPVIPNSNLSDCIDAYFSEEVMNYWTCDKCNCKANSKKSQRLWRLPRILIISLKRFSSNSTKIEITTTDLNLNKYILTKNIHYKLVAVALHYGNLNSGHYSAIVKKDKYWFEIDDASVKNVGEQLPEYCHRHGYTFFYVKS
jgi:ubiquitin carboxyl-terminal hydrolase 8